MRARAAWCALSAWPCGTLNGRSPFTLRARSLGREAEMMPGALAAKNAVPIKKFAKIGRPGFRATKVREGSREPFLDGNRDG